VPVGELLASLEAFRTFLAGSPDSAALTRYVQGNFDLLEAAGDEDFSVLFTGYYEPVLEGSRTENVDRLKSDAEDASNGIELWEEDFTEHRQDSDCADGESNCARASIVQSPEGNWMLRSLAGHPKRWLGLKSIPLECAPGALDYLVGLTN
jgi:membrane-bound lytic murein transglycosylase